MKVKMKFMDHTFSSPYFFDLFLKNKATNFWKIMLLNIKGEFYKKGNNVKK